jgi:hypothetical protein
LITSLAYPGSTQPVIAEEVARAGHVQGAHEPLLHLIDASAIIAKNCKPRPTPTSSTARARERVAKYACISLRRVRTRLCSTTSPLSSSTRTARSRCLPGPLLSLSWHPSSWPVSVRLGPQARISSEG